MTKTITLTLTESQIRVIRFNRVGCDKLINAGRCCEMSDLGLTVIDLYNVLNTLERAIDKTIDKSLTL